MSSEQAASHLDHALWGTVEPVDDLVAFLAARLDEDEAAAQEAHYESQRWLTEEEGVYRWPDDELVHAADRKADARHIARHDPARVLREAGAKRAAVRRCAARMNEMDVYPNGLISPRALLARQVLMYLAAVYSDHPGYRAEWKP